MDLVNRTEDVDLSNVILTLTQCFQRLPYYLLNQYVANGEWELVSATQKRNVVMYSCCEEPYPDVTFYVGSLFS